MDEYTSEPVRTRRGGQPVQIPAEVAEWCDQTYMRSVRKQIPMSEEDPDAPAMLRALRIYATRCGKKIDTQFLTLESDGKQIRVLRFAMRDPRPYSKAALPTIRD